MEKVQRCSISPESLHNWSVQRFLKKPIAQQPALAYIPAPVSQKVTDSITCGTDN